jgi:hypothetical protein
MTAEEFYEDFKAALRHVHPRGWKAMDQIKLDLDGNTIRLRYKNTTAGIQVPKRSANSTKAKINDK